MHANARAGPVCVPAGYEKVEFTLATLVLKKSKSGNCFRFKKIPFPLWPRASVVDCYEGMP